MALTRITPEVLTYRQVSMTNAARVVDFLIKLFARYGVHSTSEPIMNSGVPDYQITVSQPGYVSQIANLDDWIVVGFQGRDGQTPEVHIYPNHVFLQMFTDDVPTVWSATSTAPVATPLPGSSATVVVPQPGSPNGPWGYVVSQTNVTTGVTGPASLAGSPVLDQNGVLHFTVTGLVVDNQYTFSVTVTTTYADVASVTSLASNSITAIT